MSNASLTDTLVALVHFANDWHNGGGSRGYRLLCLALRACKRRGQHWVLDLPMLPHQQDIYDAWETAQTDPIAGPGVRRWPGSGV